MDDKLLELAGYDKKAISFLSRHATNRRYYHSCFISYSSQDEKFVSIIYEDLINAGVPCWLAPKNMPIGVELEIPLMQK